MTIDLSSDSQQPTSPEAPILTNAELIRRVALIHAAIDEYELTARAEWAMRNSPEERARQRSGG